MAEVACLRVVAIREWLPGPEVGLVLRRDVLSEELKSFLRNAPPQTPARPWARLTAARWLVEQSIQDTKDEWPPNQYALRSWRRWDHHVIFILIAHLFLVRVQQGL